MSVLISCNHPSVNSNLSIASPRTITNVSCLGGQDSGFVRGPPEHASRGGGQQLSPQKEGGGGYHRSVRLAICLLCQMAYIVLKQI